MATTKNEQQTVKWSELLARAVSTPGSVLEAYTAFHRFSTGNQMLAFATCAARGITPGPLATYRAWQAKGRQVRKGQKAIALTMPVTCKAKRETTDGREEEFTFSRFIVRPNWFVLSQTDGDAIDPDPVPGWDRETALDALGIESVPFEHTDGNTQGYATGRTIAINPVAQLPAKTTFHELAHVVLGHTDGGNVESDGQELPRSLKEAEAESVALLCLESLGMDGAEYCRGYIQNWLSGAEIPEKSAQRIFRAADAILKAGQA